MDSRLKLILKGDPEEVIMLLIRLVKPDVVVPHCEVISQFGDIITSRVKRKYLIEVYNSPDTFSVKAPRLVTASLKEELAASEDSKEFDEIVNPSRRLQNTFTGEGVYFAAVDWGFDFAHKNLRNEDGTTRFKCFWDQNGIYDGNKYGYGCYYSEDEINQALKTNTPYQTLGYHPGKEDLFARGMHATHVVDIAAGRPAVGEGGVAEKCRLVAVQMGNNFVNGSDLALGDSVKLVEAIDYIHSVTQDAPCVINLSLGSQGDSHTGLSLAEIAFDNFLSKNPGYAIVQSVGNYYTSNCHVHHTLQQNEQFAIEWEIPRRNLGPHEAEIWYPGTDEFSLKLTTPDGETVADLKPFQDIQVSFEGEPFGYVFHRAKEPNTGLNHIDIILDISVISGKWKIELIGTKIRNGSFHAFCERNDASQSKFSAQQTSSNTTTGSVCNSSNTIVVGAYNHRKPSMEVVSFSSSGPTALGRAKPDLLAPGFKIIAAKSASPKEYDANNGNTTKSGSSMASPHVAGAVALFFQKHLPKKILIEDLKKSLFASLDPLPQHFSNADLVRAGRGYLNINKFLGLTKKDDMNTAPLTRPVPRNYGYTHTEEVFESESEHAPFLHENCEHCKEALLNQLDAGVWGAEQNLLNALIKSDPGLEPINAFDVYRHFHPSYTFNNSPFDAGFTPVGLPGSRLKNTIETGDIVLSRFPLSGKTIQAIITSPVLRSKTELNGSSTPFDKDGYYATAYGNKSGQDNEKLVIRILDKNNRTPDHVVIIRINKNLDEGFPESGFSEDTVIKEFNLKFVKYGKGGGYQYPGDSSIPYEDIFQKSNFSDLEVRMARHFLQTEGGIDSINTYDNQVITWGFGFAGKSGNFTIALFDLFSVNPAAAADFGSFGVALTSPAKSSLKITDDQTYSGEGAIDFLKLSKKYLNILITLTQKYAQDAFEAQWRTFKKIHKIVFEAFQDGSYLANMPSELEKNKSKTAILHAHHHYPGFNPPHTFKNAGSFEEVLQIYVNQSSKFGSVQDHADIWRRNINKIFSGSTPVVPPPPSPQPQPVPPIPGNTTRRTIRMGASGSDVVYLQQRLNYHLAGSLPLLKEDGYWGQKTLTALLAFQALKGLVADGVVGPKTWASLDADRADVLPIVSTIQQGLHDLTSTANYVRKTIGESVIETFAETSIEEAEWSGNAGIHARYASADNYKPIRDKVVTWGIADPATYIESAIQEWNANSSIHEHFNRNFDGDSHRSYLNLKRLYEARNITNPAGYFSANIVPITFFNRKTVGHADLKTILDNAQAALTAAGNTFTLDRGTWSFVPRTFNNSINKLSNHALGKAIDINPAVNFHILSSDDVLVIDAVCSSVLPNGFLRESDPDTLLSASSLFQQTFNGAWIAQQNQQTLLNAIRKRRSALNSYALRGFLNLPSVLIRGLQNAGLSWGGAWTSAKDFMHFELPNP